MAVTSAVRQRRRSSSRTACRESRGKVVQVGDEGYLLALGVQQSHMAAGMRERRRPNGLDGGIGPVLSHCEAEAVPGRIEEFQVFRVHGSVLHSREHPGGRALAPALRLR